MIVAMVLIGWLVVGKVLWMKGLWTKLLLMSLGAGAYLFWVILGLSPALAWLVAPLDQRINSPWPLRAWPSTRMFLGGELALMGGVILATLPVNPGGILRILLLPILAHAVIFLRWSDVALFTVLSNGIFWHLHSQTRAGVGIAGFLLECGTTITFTYLWISAERFRAATERIATDLAVANRELGAYAIQAEELAEVRERNRLAREIHDSLGHYLTVVRVQLEAALALPEVDAKSAVNKAHTLAGEGLREIRNSVGTLRASPLDQRTLCEALLALVSEHECGGLKVQIEVLGTERDLSTAVNLTLYRAAQEGLTNVRKHAPGTSPRLTLDFRNNNTIRLMVSDDGPGSISPAGGFGLLGLRERSALLGGSLCIQTNPNEGFTLTIELPL
jgi:signal transduction histidine kinase